MSCPHIRQNRLPCATPGCRYTVLSNELEGLVVTAKGRRAGWRMDSVPKAPESVLQPVKWIRGEVQLIPGEKDTASAYIWVPGTQAENVSWQRCFRSFIPLFCPNDGTCISKSKIYKKNVTYLVACPTCGVRWMPILEGGMVTWYDTSKKEVGSNTAIPVMEYPE